MSHIDDRDESSEETITPQIFASKSIIVNVANDGSQLADDAVYNNVSSYKSLSNPRNQMQTRKIGLPDCINEESN